jgi:hypothetical protein
VTFVSFQDNGKGDRMIAFRLFGDPDGIRTGYFPKSISRSGKQLLEIMGFHMRR